MPWKETRVVDERMRFVVEARKGVWPMTELCERFGISRRTGYKYLRRVAEEGPAGLHDRSRAPHSHPNKTPREVEREVLRVRRRYPLWGSKKIRAWLERHRQHVEAPARSTIDRIVKEAGLTGARKRRRGASPTRLPVVDPDSPNRVWCVDFKGWFRLGDGQRCDPLTAEDGYSRYSILCEPLIGPRLEDVQRCFEKAFRGFGLPDVIRSDNGPPFASTGLAGLTRLSVWWLRLGILPERIEPGKPQQNGRLERFHRTLKDETASPPRSNLQAQGRAFRRFQRVYNEERPHEALDFKTPAQLYESSPRRYPSRLPEYGYSDHQVRRVQRNGCIKWHQRRVFLSESLDGEDVGLQPVGHGIWRVFLGRLSLGDFHQASGSLMPATSRTRRRPRSETD